VSGALRWEETALGDVAELERNIVGPERIASGTRYVGLEHITKDGDLSAVELVAAGDLRSAKFAFSERHLLYGKLRPYLRKVARPAFSGVCSTDIIPILPGPTLNRDYLFHCLRQPTLVALATARSEGANLPRLSPKALLTFRVPIPPFAEQRRIAAMLDKADAIRRKRRESITLLDEFLRSAFHEMFGDTARNDRGWPVGRLAEYLSFMTSGSRGWAKYYSDTGRPFLRIQNVGRNELRLEDLAYVNPPVGAEADRTTVLAGDLLLSITADLGRTAVVTPAVAGGHINQHLALLRLRDLEPLFVAEFLASTGGRRQFEHLNRQAVKAGLNFDDIRSLRIPLPPKPLQAKLAELFHGKEKTLAALRTGRDETERLCDSLAQQAFSGG
jgi:type I restriction enzyme S subunit